MHFRYMTQNSGREKISGLKVLNIKTEWCTIKKIKQGKNNGAQQEVFQQRKYLKVHKD